MRRFVPMPGCENLAETLRGLAGGVLSVPEMRRFPDGEHYVRLAAGEGDAIVVANLARPDAAILPLLFAADALRDQGARRVVLIAPYLPYLRQDRRFHPGEAVSSVTFARLLSNAFDGLVTVDPHLHRYAGLAEVFSIPTRLASAAPLLGAWIGANIERPLVIGPDAESAPWAGAAAQAADAPLVTLEKVRLGDRKVTLKAPGLSAFAGRTPVLVDDIFSSGATAIQAARLLASAGFPAPVVAVTHMLASPGRLRRLAPHLARTVSSDTVSGPTNQVTMAASIAAALRELECDLDQGGAGAGGIS